MSKANCHLPLSGLDVEVLPACRHGIGLLFESLDIRVCAGHAGPTAGNQLLHCHHVLPQLGHTRLEPIHFLLKILQRIHCFRQEFYQSTHTFLFVSSIESPFYNIYVHIIIDISLVFVCKYEFLT